MYVTSHHNHPVEVIFFYCLASQVFEYNDGRVVVCGDIMQDVATGDAIRSHCY